MRYKVTAATFAWACITWIAASQAQTVHQADFDTTFPDFGYTFDYAGYGTPAPDFLPVDSPDEAVSATYDVDTPPAGTATFDTSMWVYPAPPDSSYTYAGWGFGIGLFLPVGTRPTSPDLSLYTVDFDAFVTGYDPLDNGLETELNVILQIPDDDDADDRAEEVRLGATGDPVPIPVLTDEPQHFSIKLSDFAVQGTQFDLSAQFSDINILILQLAPKTNAGEIGLDANNVLTVDNVKFVGPFAVPFGGDFDGDDDVNGEDFLLWQRGESPNGGSAADLAVWKANFGQTAPNPGVSAVPEPGGLVLTSAAALALLVGGVRVNRRLAPRG